MHQIYSLLLLFLLVPLASHARDSQPCAASISELRNLLDDQTFPLKWEETTMNDGKPLVVTIFEKSGVLSVEFIKTRQGLWAQSFGVVCKTDVALEIRFNGEQIHFGPSAGWILRSALGHGGKFTLTRLEPKKLRIATTGWSGVFNQSDK
ncbi:MAG TPA: hypothetical protein VFX90_01915 [Rhodoferax sp.]|nr:hypothetical protein [Rhodoferax sp.]